MDQLEIRCKIINKFFNTLEVADGKLSKSYLVAQFKEKHPKVESDLNYCFEVLAGKHKLGYTYCKFAEDTRLGTEYLPYKDLSIQNFVNNVLKQFSSAFNDIIEAFRVTPPECVDFIQRLVNREFRLGYSNKDGMITHYSPMLAKRYPETVHEQDYYIQEKLDGNRCIATFNCDTQKWEFWSRSGKPLNVNFDMSWADSLLEKYNEYPTFDGEIMTLEHAGTRDFTKTSGAINSKYGDKSQLHYYIYDIIATKMKYEDRKQILDTLVSKTGNDCSILPVLDRITVYVNPQYNWKLDEWLDKITSQGGEGIMLRDPYATYQVGKRSDALIKYKKVQTMDLRIVDWNEGEGKYAGAIGSFVCETDDGTISVNVSGMSDDVRFSNPEDWLGRIIEVAYFDISKSKTKDKLSLRFPRMKKVRDDKTTTSIY